MENKNLNVKIINATKWSSITEIIAKLITPITNMILARILAPEAFGVVATITMIISFADMLTDSGFQKYLVQHEFRNESEKIKYTNVAFWTNLFISIFLWIIIIATSDVLASLVGNDGLGNVISIACIQLPITSFSSIQMAIYRRDFDFKTLFNVRIISIFTPFFITIPLAMLGLNYWSLIIGNIFGNFINAVMLTVRSKWKPSYYYNFDILKEMISFSIWTLIESISIWLTTWIDTFIIGSFLSSYYLGVYKNSLSMVNSIFTVVIATTTPILFSALSRVQNDDKEFKKIFFSMQKTAAYIILPMAIGMYVYRDFMVKILFGDRWIEGNQVVGLWALTSGIVILFGNYFSEVYRAKGKPKLSFIVQVLHLIVLIPVCSISGKFGFEIFVKWRVLIRLQLVLVHILVMNCIIKIPVIKIFKNIFIPAISSIFMGIVGVYLNKLNNNIMWNLLSIIICVNIYFGVLMLFKKSRQEVFNILHTMKIKKIFINT